MTNIRKEDFGFEVDKEQHSIKITRTFSAHLDLVWDAWTKPELLDQWWAPKPWKSKTKYMNFEVNGSRLYAMVGPEGEEHWGKTEFLAIQPKTNFDYKDSFCDSEGNENLELPSSTGSTSFSEIEAVTTVFILMNFATLKDLETNIAMGFKEGMAMALENLDEVLNSLKK